MANSKANKLGTPYSVIGVDFGTSTTVVRVGNYDEAGNCHGPYPIVDSTNDELPYFVSLVFEKEDGTMLYAGEARKQITGGKAGTGTPHQNFKMDLISDDPGKQESAKKCIRGFLAFIKMQLDNQALKNGMSDRRQLFFSVPAKWPKLAIDFMKSAYIEAGFVTDEADIIYKNEPQAASVWTIHEKLETIQEKGWISQGEPATFLMIDMGAGTTDLTFFKLQIDNSGELNIDDSSIFSYPTISDHWLCGGREIDTALHNYVQELRGKSTTPQNPKVLQAVKEVKDRELSDLLTHSESYDWMNKYTDLEDSTDDTSMGRQQFEKATETQWDDFHELLRNALENAKSQVGISPSDIDFVILTGGHSNWYCVTDILLDKPLSSGTFGKALELEKIKAEPERILGEELRHSTVANGLCIMDNAQFSFEKMRIGNKTVVNAGAFCMRMAIGDLWSDWKLFDLEGVDLPCTKKFQDEYLIEEKALKQKLQIKIEMARGTPKHHETPRLLFDSESKTAGGTMRMVGTVAAGLLIAWPVALGIVGYQLLHKRKMAVVFKTSLTFEEKGGYSGSGKILVYSADSNGKKKGNPTESAFEFENSEEVI